MEVSDAIEAIEASGTIDELGLCFQRVIEDLGFASYTLIEASEPDAAGRFLIPTRDKAWDDEYRSSGFIDVDPVVSHALRSNVPFAWSDVGLPKQAGVRKPAARKLMDAARDHGLENGLVVPFQVVDTVGRGRSMICTFFWKDKKSRFFGLLKAHRRELHLLMIYFTHQALEIHAASLRLRAAGGPTEPPVTLTDRERSVLTWAARGKTVADTAVILDISSETVETHIRNAMRKLDALNKTHAAVKAMKAGLIDV